MPYLVFSQRPSLDLDEAELKRHAAQFFSTRLGVARSNAHIEIVLGTNDTSGTRALSPRPRTDADLTVADAAERRAGGGGLAALARRCPTVWTISAAADDDPLALRVAAILAGVLLGPILTPDGALLGPTSARARLASR